MRVRLSAWSTMLTTGLATAALAGGCRPAPERATAPPLTTASVMTAPGRSATAMATARAPAELLPQETDVVVTAASAVHLLRMIDVAALIARYRPQYEEAGAYLEQIGGAGNVLDPLRWPAIGVDPHGTVGAAVLDRDAGALCLFVTLTDPARLRGFAERVGTAVGDGGEFGPVFAGHGTVLSYETGAKLSLVLRDDFAFLVTVEHPSRASRDFARELASVDPIDGLMATPRWQKALGAATPRDLVAFVDVGGMLRADQASKRRREASAGPTWAEQELQRLREQGAPSEEIGRWEAIVSEQRVAEAQHRERERRSHTLWDAVFGPLGPIVVELSLSEREIGGTARALVPEPGLLRRLLAGPGAPALAMTAASEKVLFGTGGRLDVNEALGVVSALLTADAAQVDSLAARVKEALDVDLGAALAAIDGGVSFALTSHNPRALTTSKASPALGFNLALGLKDPALTLALIEGVAPKLAWKTRRAKSRDYVVTVPHWREVYIAVVGPWLAISTDPEFARRIEREADGPLDRALPAAVVPVVTTREAAAVMMLDHAALLGISMARSSEDKDMARHDHPMQNQPYWRFPSVSHAAIDGVPQSAAYKTRLKEWQRLDAKAQSFEEVQERRRSGLAIAAAESLGALAINVRETDEGLATAGGQFFGPGGLAKAIEIAIDGFLNVDEPDPAAQTIHEAIGQVEQDLQEIRARDIERALGVQQAQ